MHEINSVTHRDTDTAICLFLPVRIRVCRKMLARTLWGTSLIVQLNSMHAVVIKTPQNEPNHAYSMRRSADGHH